MVHPRYSVTNCSEIAVPLYRRLKFIYLDAREFYYSYVQLLVNYC